MVKKSDQGLRTGENHQRAQYSNHEVELVRQLREDKLSYGQIARRMEMPKSTVRDIVKFRTRAWG